MDFLQPILNCLNNLCSCCLNCTEAPSTQGLEPNERTRLVDPVNSNSSPLRRNNSDNFSNEYSQSLPKKDEQTALSRLVQNTAIDMIDVGAMDSHLEVNEYNDRAKLYSQRLQQQWSNVQHPSNALIGLLKDIPNPELYLISTPISAPDLALIKNAISKAQLAVEEIKPELPADALAAIERITDAEIMASINRLSDDANFEKLVKQFINQVQYSGFDVVKFRKYIYSIIGTDDEKLKFLIYAVVIFLVRGNKISKIIDTCPVEFKPEIIKIRQTFRIQDNIGKHSKGFTTVTLSRIASAFPLLAMKAIYLGSIDRVATIQYVFPNAIKCSLSLPVTMALKGAGNVRLSTLRKKIIKATYYYLAHEAQIISPDAKKMDNIVDVAKSLITYIKAAMKSPVPIEQEVRTLYVEWGILVIDVNKDLTQVDGIIEAATAFDDWGINLDDLF